jgi:hypothetical protein
MMLPEKSNLQMIQEGVDRWLFSQQQSKKG